MKRRLGDALRSILPATGTGKAVLELRFRACIALLAVLCCFSAGCFAPALASPLDDTAVKLMLALTAGWLVIRASYYFRPESLVSLLFLSLAVCTGIYLRMLSLNVETLDYQNFLAPWTEHFREDGLHAFKDEFSNYNMPYLYMLSIVARLPIKDLYAIKLFSILFDSAMVLTVLRIGRHFKFSAVRLALMAAAVFLAPTVWLNSAYWGQCDMIYAYFIVTAFLFILEKRPSLSFVMAALAFSFKLQAIFFLPCYLIFLITRRVRLRQFLIFPAVYFLSVLPAWLLGKSWKEIIGVYYEQANTAPHILNFNSPSVYALIWIPEDFPYTSFFFTAGIVCAALLILVLAFMAWERRFALNDRALTVLALCMVLGVPWFLPCMHERYFFLADMFFIFTAFLVPRCWYFVPIGIFCSYAGYHAYIFVRYIAYIGVVLPSLLMLFMLGRAMLLFWDTTEEEDGDGLPLDSQRKPPPLNSQF